MTILAFPAITPNSNSWGITANGTSARSELDGSVQTLSLPGDKWSDTLTFTNLVDPKARILRAFLASLRGEAGRFYLTPPGYVRAGSAPGTPLVNGGNQHGNTIVTDGWTASRTGILLVGDYFTIGGELKMVAADANSDSSGNSTISFVPPIRVSPTDNSAVVVNAPTAIMKLKDNAQAKWPSTPGHIYAFSMAVEEALV